MGQFGGSCRCATPCVLAAPDYRRRRLRAHGGLGSASPAKLRHYPPVGSSPSSQEWHGRQRAARSKFRAATGSERSEEERGTSSSAAAPRRGAASGAASACRARTPPRPDGEPGPAREAALLPLISREEVDGAAEAATSGPADHFGAERHIMDRQARGVEHRHLVQPGAS